MDLPSTYIHLIEKAAENLGRSDATLLAVIERLKEVASRKSYQAENLGQFITSALEQVDEPRLSFEVGKLLGLETHGFFGYAIKASKNLEEAILFEEKFMPVRSKAIKVRLNSIGNTKFSISLIFDAPDQALPFLTEIMVSCFVKVFTDLAGQGSTAEVSKHLKRLSLKLSYPEPKYRDIYTAYFPFDISFDEPFTELIGPQDLLYRKNRNYDPSLHKLMVSQVEAELNDKYSEKYSDKVKKHIQQHISEDISVSTLSSKLNMSERTLKRKLRIENTSFRQLLLNTRMEESKKLMSKGDLTIEQVSYQLGYKHPSTFSNAFKNKFGIAPRSYMESIFR